MTTTEQVEPTLVGLLSQLPSNPRLSNAQIELAGSLIEYRKKHFSMAYGGGRTTVVNAVQKYFKKCGYPRAGREI